jgi:YD repeat-containing protein
MIFRNPKARKTIAIFLLLNMVNYIVYPTVSWALTSGPTAPEATSFEPVDTTDMVNLATGDFTYNMPLLEIPGPSGGYPLSLSYHAGIKLEEEASWVGLGWTLNPGAITRMVNGYADDLKETKGTRRDYWAGGETSTFKVGTTVGYGGVGGASVGLSFSQDTYEGFGMGGYLGFGLKKNFGQGSIGIGAQVETSGYGSSYANLGVNAGIGLANKNDVASGFGISASAGVSTNFNTVSGYASSGVSYSKNGVNIGSLGASISSIGLKPSASIGGGRASQSNSKAGKISSESSGFSVSIPVQWGSIDLGYNQVRYWSDEKSNIRGTGALFPSFNGVSSDAYDSYALLNPNSIDKSADEEIEGSFPAYDNYNVSAQGLGGSIQPFISKNIQLYRQNVSDENGASVIRYRHINTDFDETLLKPNFRFLNDFSNNHLVTPPDFSASIVTIDYDEEEYDFIPQLEGYDSSSPAEGFDDESSNESHLAGSKHVEYFTNLEINNDTAKNKGFINCHVGARGLTSYHSTDLSDQIGGFMITNESGVTYHYAQPAYAYGERQRIQKIEDPSNTWTQIDNDDAYAYTWYLTGLTGPDYVDRNDDGMLDKGDWGYWVKIDYGLWADNYKWRTPDTGTNKDLDQSFEYYSYGKKEVLYLNTVSTKTHTAFFEKSIRADGKSVISLIQGGFGEKERLLTGSDPDCQDNDPNDQIDECEVFTYYKEFSTPSLKLNNIFLVENEKINGFSNLQQLLSSYGAITSLTFPGDAGEVIVKPFNGENVLDSDDLNQIADQQTQETYRSQLLSISTRVIDFKSDYSLQDDQLDGIEGVPNSYDEDGSSFSVSATSEVDKKLGKLTLKSIEFKGKKGVNILPPTSFLYAKNRVYEKEKYDLWGFYKSDFDNSSSNNNNRLRFTSENSSEFIDTWSLTTINSVNGSELRINYESDSYKTVYEDQTLLPFITDLTYDADNYGYLNFTLDGAEMFNKYYTVDDTIELHVLFGSRLNYGAIPELPGLKQSTIRIYAPETGEDVVPFENYSNSVIKSIDGEVWRIYNTSLYDALKNKTSNDDLLNALTISDFIAGNVKIRNNVLREGGGIRVNEISIFDPYAKISMITKFLYTDVEDNESSGISSFSPTNMAVFSPNYPEDSSWPDNEYYDDEMRANLVKTYTSHINNEYMEVISRARELQKPGVIYKNVRVFNSINDSNNNSTAISSDSYEFKTFDKNDVNIIQTTPTDVGKNIGDGTPAQQFTFHTRNTTLQDFTSKVGRIIKNSSHDSKGNTLMQTEFSYLDDLTTLENKFLNQGVIQQSFSEVKEAGGLKGVISKREEYPSVLTKTTTTNFKTGITQTTENLAFDFYSGQPTKVLTTDGYGNAYISETTPAYRVTNADGSRAYESMGLKVGNINNYNMLTQEGSSVTYKVNPTTKTPISLLSAGVQTWNDTWTYKDENPNNPDITTNEDEKVWRKHKSYGWVGAEDLNSVNVAKDGTYDLTNYEANKFTAWAAGDPDPTGWQKNNEVTLYNQFSHALEAKDKNGHFAATKMDVNNEFVYASVANAGYEQFAYSGAEDAQDAVDYMGGRVLKDANTTIIDDEAQSHTGSKALQVTSGGYKPFIFNIPSENLSTGNIYRVSVWSNNSNLDLKADNATPLGVMQVKQAGNWFLNSQTFKIDNGTIDASFYTYSLGTVIVDDFRVHPIDAAMTSYVYNQWGEVSHILDANNLFTEYRYDAAGRLIETYRESFKYGVKKVSSTDYHYANQN